MMYAKRILPLLLILTCNAWSMNRLLSYNPLLRPMPMEYDRRVQWYSLVETGVDSRAYNQDGCSVSALQVWNNDQNALAMLNGFDSQSAIGQKRILLDANDDGVRGHFAVCGDLELKAAAAMAVRWQPCKGWFLGLHVPLYAMKLADVRWIDQTKQENEEDALVHNQLTDDLFAQVKLLGNGLNLSGWERTGAGDLTLLLEWYGDFPQRKQFLKKVGITWRAGAVLPTGKRMDVDKIMAIPFGTNGAVGLPFGMGMDLLFGSHVRFGFDVQLMHTFGAIRPYRVKTSADQTELLLLKKIDAYCDYGLTQQFSMYAELFRLFGGLSARVGYQYFKHGDDELSPVCDTLDRDIINNAESLQEWVHHQIIARLEYEWAALGGADWCVMPPTLGLFARIPFKGKRVAAAATVGVSLSFQF